MQKRTDEPAGVKATPPEKPDTDRLDLSEFQVRDPDEFVRNLVEVFDQSRKVMDSFVDKSDSQVGAYSAFQELNDATKTMGDLWQTWFSQPVRLAQAQTELAHGYVEIWNNYLRRMMGDEVEPTYVGKKRDNRFKDPAWDSNPYFAYWKEAFVFSSQWTENMLAETEGLDNDQRQKAEFHLRLLLSALAPTNFPATNPEVMRETFATNAENLVRGIKNLSDDLQGSGDLLKISQTDAGAFEVGENLATAPGKIVFQNDVFQLIQYTPTTDEVWRTPLLIVPPWINKFYILDLTEQKSFVRFAVSQGDRKSVV